MNIKQLGEFEQELWVFCGAYSNLQTLSALQEQAKLRGVDSHHIINLGDVVAYCAQPEQTVQRLRDWGVHSMLGNCEQSIADHAPDCGCGFDEGSTCSLLSVQWYAHAQKTLSTQSKAWMHALPLQLECTLAGKTIRFIHGGVEVMNEFIFPSTDRDYVLSQLHATGADIVVGGHSGIAFGHRFEQENGGHKAWLNCGALGMPANDGSSDTWFMRLVPLDNAIHVHWERLEYDVVSAQCAMDVYDKNGVPSPYKAALSSGIWPSQSILPACERGQKGTRLSLPSLVI